MKIEERPLQREIVEFLIAESPHNYWKALFCLHMDTLSYSGGEPKIIYDRDLTMQFNKMFDEKYRELIGN